MTLILSGTDGLSDIDGSAATPAIRGTDTNTGIFFPAADTIAFAEGGAEVARFDSSGNFGLGTSSPSGKMDVTGSSGTFRVGTAGDSISFTKTGTNYISTTTAGGQLLFQTGAASNAMLIDSSNNVGIGTTSPLSDSRLTLTSSTANKQLAWTDATNGTAWLSTGTGASRIWSNVALVFGSGSETFTERARIDSSGNLLVGTTSQPVSTYRQVIQYSGNGGQGGIMFNDTDGGQTLEACYFRKDGGQRGYIRVTTSGTTYATVSDYRLKTDVAPMIGALAKVMALNPCTYTWKETNKNGQGFIAHELAEVVPDCVTGEKDAVETYTDEEGNEQTRPKYQGIDTSFLVATLTAAIQEQQAIIQSLTARIEALEGK